MLRATRLPAAVVAQSYLWSVTSITTGSVLEPAAYVRAVQDH
jgi:hypothetical protein